MTAHTRKSTVAAPRPADSASLASKAIPEPGVVHVFNSQETKGLEGTSKGWMFGSIPNAAKADQFDVMLERPKPTACLCPVSGAAGGGAHAMCDDMHLDSQKRELL